MNVVAKTHGQEKFGELFDEAVELLRAKGNSGSARQAVEEMFAAAYALLRDSHVAAPAFASHAADHSVRLAMRLNEIARELTIETESPLRHMDTLVLAFSAFAWHDVAMGVIPQDYGSQSMEAIWGDQAVRCQHAERSAEKVEQLADGPMQDHPMQWRAYWQHAAEGREWPTPVSQWMLRVLARIVQSHGGSASEWLDQESLLKYEQQSATSGPTATIQFNEQWAGGWKEFEPVYLSAVALLNLCDLLDICPERHILPGTEDLQKRTFVSAQNSVGAFPHWLGNQVLRVSLDTSSAVAKCRHPGTEGNPLWTRIPLGLGPGQTLTEFGSDERLVRLLNETAGIGFNGVDVDRGPTDIVAWEKALSLIESGPFSEGWTAAPINERLANYNAIHDVRTGASSVLDSLVWRACFHAESDSSQAEDEPLEIWLANQLLVSGYRFDALMQTDKAATGRNRTYVYAEKPADRTNAARCGIGDSFLAMASHLRQLMSANPEVDKIYFTQRGDSLHRKVMDGEDSKALARGAVVILVRSGATVDEYRSLVADSETRGFSVHFLCEKPEHATRLKAFGAKMINFAPVDGATQLLRETVGRIERGLGGLRVTERTDSTPVGESELSPMAMLSSLYLESMGLTALLEKVRGPLNDPGSVDHDKARGVVLLTSLLELLDTPGRSDDRADARIEYEEARTFASLASLPDVESVEAWVSGSPLVAHSGMDRPHRQEARAQFLKETSPAIPELAAIQARALYSAAIARRLFNLKVLCTEWGKIRPQFWCDIVRCLFGNPNDSTFRRSTSTLDGMDVNARLGLGIAGLVQRGSMKGRREFTAWLAKGYPDLQGFVGIIVFQMLYVMLKGEDSVVFWKSGSEGVEFDAILDSETGRLAVLEAIGSKAKEYSEDERVFASKLAEELAVLLESRFGGLEPTRCHIMAYDIAYRYAQRRREFADYVECLWGDEIGGEWLSIVRYFHETPAELPDKRIRASRLWTDWWALRSKFLSIQEHAPKEVAREAISEDLQSRVPPGGGDLHE